jgi:hypothetical protein
MNERGLVQISKYINPPDGDHGGPPGPSEQARPRDAPLKRDGPDSVAVLIRIIPPDLLPPIPHILLFIFLLPRRIIVRIVVPAGLAVRL